MQFATVWRFFRIYQIRPSFSLSVVLGIVVAILIFPSRETIPPHSIEFTLSGLIFGEILLPPVIGWLASGVVLRDPFLEVMLSTPYSQVRLTLKRLFVQLASALTVWLVFFTAIWRLAEQPQMNLAKLGLGVLPVLLLFSATGLWSSLRLGTWTGGGICVALLWGSGLVFRQSWLGLFAPLYPFLTYFSAENGEHHAWWVNRLLLCAVSGILILDACRLIKDEESLLKAGKEGA